MSDPLCRDCRERGSEVKATRLIGKTPVCDTHMRQRLGMAPAAAMELEHMKPTQAQRAEFGRAGAGSGDADRRSEEERPRMAKRIDEATRREILKDHAQGMKVNAIATKHGVGWITAKTIIARGEGGDANKSSGKRGRPKNAKVPAAGAAAGRFDLTATLLYMRTERDRLDRAISALEELDA